MIAPPSGWAVSRRADRLLLVPAEGALATIEYREVVRPVLDISALVDNELARDTRFVADGVGPFVPLVTHEGEYAALVTASGHVGGRSAQRDLGFVLTDDYYACANGLSLVSGRFADLTRTVRALVMTDSHGLGTRRRRFRYLPPPGWQPSPRGLETDWYPRGNSRAAAVISVWPAWPISDGSVSMVDRVVEQAGSSPEFAVLDMWGPYPVTARSGLRGSGWDIVGSPPERQLQRRTIVVLEDDRYVYSARLEVVLKGSSDDARGALFTLIASAEPIPRGRDQQVSGEGGQEIWSIGSAYLRTRRRTRCRRRAPRRNPPAGSRRGCKFCTRRRTSRRS
jgi:hypothetical protein